MSQWKKIIYSKVCVDENIYVERAKYELLTEMLRIIIYENDCDWIVQVSTCGYQLRNFAYSGTLEIAKQLALKVVKEHLMNVVLSIQQIEQANKTETIENEYCK